MNTRLIATYRVASSVISSIVISIGLLVLLGWLFSIPALKSMLPGLATMKANTALAFVLAGVSLWLVTGESKEQRAGLIAKICATITMLIGLLTLCEYVLGVDFGIDQLFFKDEVSAQNEYPGRMSPATSLNLLLLGWALLIIDSKWGNRLYVLLTSTTMLIAGVAVIGYLYNITSLYKIGIYASVALHAAITSILLSLGVLLARPKNELLSTFTNNDPAGILARRLLPVAIGIPIVLGWLRLTGQRMGLYNTEFGEALFALSNVIIFSALIWWNARMLSRVEADRGQAERALNLSKQRSQALIENSWDAIALFGTDGSILYGSPSTTQILGYSLDEFVGKNAFDLIHQEDQAVVTERFKLALEQPGKHVSVYARVRHKNGAWRWLEGMFTNLLHEPSVQAIVNNYHDFTERKEAEDASRRMNDELEKQVQERTAALSQANTLLQMLLDHTPDHIYFKDAQSRFIRNSRSQAKALGLNDPAEAIGKSDFDFFPHAQQSFEKEQEIIHSGTLLVDDEEWVLWPDGQATWVSTTKAPLRDPQGKIIGTFGISRDITDRKQAEIALQKAKLELEAANRELEAFSYSVSHDLRAPLRSIDGFSQALLEDYREILPPEGRNFLERIRRSVQRMADLIDDLLNLSRVIRAPLKSVTVDLSKLAERVAAELKRNNPERDVRFIIAQNLTATGDPHLLQIVLENFINNAWKFTSKRELAEIEIGTKSENGESIYFIHDNGAGFDMTYVNKLFGAFQRLHAMTEFPGTGIGLATIQRIIHRHGGRVWAEGAVDQGATFFFTLPVLVGTQASTAPKETEEDSIYKRAREII